MTQISLWNLSSEIVRSYIHKLSLAHLCQGLRTHQWSRFRSMTWAHLEDFTLLTWWYDDTRNMAHNVFGSLMLRWLVTPCCNNLFICRRRMGFDVSVNGCMCAHICVYSLQCWTFHIVSDIPFTTDHSFWPCRHDLNGNVPGGKIWSN